MNEDDIVEVFERENISLASIPKRALAFTIDETIISILLIVAYSSQFQSATTPEQMILIVNKLFFNFIILKVIYQTFFVWMYGATPGKMLCKIRVISVFDVANPTIGYALMRAVVRVFSESLFYLGFIWALLNVQRASWHDLAAKTLVVDA